MVTLLNGPSPIEAPLRDVAATPAGDAPGRLAWWTGDEGVKAPLATLPPLASGDTVTQRRARQLTSVSHNPERAFPEWAQSADAQHITHSEQLRLLPAVTAETFDAHRQDVTAGNAFVLANSAEGGLRLDLTHGLRSGNPSLFHDALINDATFTYLNSGYNGADILPVRNDDSPAVRWPTHPIITECVLACGVAADIGTPQTPGSSLRFYDVVLYYYLFMDVWNPHSMPLSTGPTSPDIEVRVTGLPQVTIPNSNAVMPEALTIPVDVFFDMEAGEVQLLAEPTDDEGTTGNGVNQVPLGQIALLPTQTQLNIPVSFSASTVLLEFFDRTQGLSAEPFQILTLGPFDAFQIFYNASVPFLRTAGSVEEGTNSVDTISRESLREPGLVFAYHFKMRDDYEATDTSLARWLTERDPREAFYALSSANIDPFYEMLAEPTAYVRDEVTHVTDFFASAFANVVTGLPDRQARLFDVPAQPAVSVGALRHLHYPGKAPFALGSPQGEALNVLYDRYFMSTLPMDIEDWDRRTTLANPRIVYSENEYTQAQQTALASEDAARHLLLQNGFNLNSVSQVAWQAVLSGLQIPDWTYHDTTEVAPAAGQVNLQNAVFSLPHRAAQHWPDTVSYTVAEDFDMTQLQDDRRHPAFIQGVRTLTDAQVEALAASIVSQLQERGRPFQSVSEFLNTGVLQNAIDAAPSLNDPDGDGLPIPYNAPASITQSSLMHHLGPFLFARSDTFTIRAYGESINPSTGETIATALCQAIVQRTANPVDDDATTYGRQFKIVSFAWLDERALD